MGVQKCMGDNKRDRRNRDGRSYKLLMVSLMKHVHDGFSMSKLSTLSIIIGVNCDRTMSAFCFIHDAHDVLFYILIY